jgi:hypothetical protein
MKSTERYSADTQIIDSIHSKISAAPRFYKLQSCLFFARYRPYDVNNYNKGLKDQAEQKNV